MRFGAISAPIFYAQGGQLNVQVPYQVAGTDTAVMSVLYQGKPAGTATVGIVPAAPALLPLAVNQDGAPNSESEPAVRTTWMTFYGTGEGLTDGANVAGLPAQSPYAHPLLPVVLKIAGVSAEILYAGSAPGMVGVIQINARVPGGFVAPGAAKVELSIGTAVAPASTIWLR